MYLASTTSGKRLQRPRVKDSSAAIETEEAGIASTEAQTQFRITVHTNAYKHPRAGILGRFVELTANSQSLAQLRRALTSRLPFLKLSSDVKSVVYLTWLVPVHLCEDLVPAGVRLWQRDGLTPFTVLTYQHTHFGPSILGSLRRLLPSPLQSNWRLYLEHAPEGASSVRTVLFLKNIMNSVVYSLGTRVFSDALPTHLAAKFVHRREGDHFSSEIVPGTGSSPALVCDIRCSCSQSLGPRFASMFGSWQSAVEFLTCQEAAVSRVENPNCLAFAEIHLPIDLSQVLPAEPLDVPPECSMLPMLQPVEGPLCFVVPNVPFRALSERLL
jgi:hypothetical protein